MIETKHQSLQRLAGYSPMILDGEAFAFPTTLQATSLCFRETW